MASKPIKDDNILGYLKRRQFDGRQHTARRYLHLNDAAMIHYAKNCPQVHRVEGLFLPVKAETNLTVEEKHLIHAWSFVKGVLSHNPHVKHSFTIIDGTDWETSKQSEEFELAIEFINVFYSNGSWTIVVCLDEMKRMKKATHYFLNNQFHKKKIFLLEFHDNYPPRLVIDKIAQSIKFTSNQGAPYLFYSNRIFPSVNAVSDPNIEYPVSAAFMMDDVIWYVPRPGRHHHILHSYEYGVFKETAKDKTLHHGFLTNHGNYVSRKRAMFMAARNSQIKGMGTFKMEYVSLSETPHTDADHRFGGIINPQHDCPIKMYSVCEVGLFSEDVW